MTATRTLLRGGRVIDPQNDVDDRLDVLIVGQHVSAVGSDLETDGAEIVDTEGCLVVPGFIDLHCHLREPGFEQKGTIASETGAALAGGFTTVCAMPNTDPPPDSAVEVEALLERIERDAAVRVLPIGCVTRGRGGKELAEITELAEASCVAVSDDGSPVADAGVMRNALALAAALDLPLSEHSDDPMLSRSGAMNEGRVSERLGLSGQPAAAEVAAIGRNIALSELTGGRLHLAHVTTARGLELVAAAKEAGLPVTCEVTPSHLLLTEDAVFGTAREPAYDSNAKINPPLRTEEDRLALLDGVNSGLIDAIATDHAPHAIEDKLCEFDRAAFGISCFDTAAATVLTLVERGELLLLPALSALTSGPARTFSLGDRISGLGSLTPGTPADITILRTGVRRRVSTAEFRSKGKNSPLDGVELAGEVVAVFLSGERAFGRGANA